ncbi:kinetochore protein NDC80 homolog isoform X2 [Phoenix dactylifera]|uniref:Kinetochore protein NDC80 n=1 Tax=Phoenix dactylifera TaxID=42345 RepID=A0A8B8ZG35_PHODC|nr:kinetochore protein NDC80 homolog isoform X2 [Phoenix dactylifera]
MQRGGRRRLPKASITGFPERAAPFDVGRPFDVGGGRDSDASLCSSRPSSAGGRPSSAASALLTDRSSQSAALRSVNAYLSSFSAPTSLRPPLPSGREITDVFRFILARLDWPLADLDDDLPALLRHLHCPIKLNRSALKAPGTPHAWPPLLSVLYWLVQLARVFDDLAPRTDTTSTNDFLLYVARSYSLFIGGDDDAVADLDDEYLRKAQHQATNATAAVEALEKQANGLEAKLRALTSGPSRRDSLERERAVLVEDVKKFQAVVDTWGWKVAAMESALGDWEKELEAKEKEIRRTCEENEELQKRIDAQTVNVRDAERMKRELQAVERDIAEAESGRNVLEEKAWELEAAVGRKLNEFEVLSEHCNQAIRKGSSPAEVLGTNYKTILKPALSALAEDTKKASVSKLEESINLQKQSRENAKMLEEKRDRLAALQFKIDDAESRLRLLKNEMEDYASKCAAEVEKMKEEFIAKEHQLCIVEKEAEEFLKNSERKLEDAVRESDEEVQMCARELLTLIDAVSEYKEYMESTISERKTDLSEVADAVSSLLTKLVISGC